MYVIQEILKIIVRKFLIFCGLILVFSLFVVQGGVGIDLEFCLFGLLDGMLFGGGFVIKSGQWFFMVVFYSFRRKIFVILNFIIDICKKMLNFEFFFGLN